MSNPSNQSTLPVFEQVNADAPKESPAVEGCKLGLPLTNCPLTRYTSCRTLYDVLGYSLPPMRVRTHIEQTLSNDPEARAWLHRLDVALAHPRHSRHGAVQR